MRIDLIVEEKEYAMKFIRTDDSFDEEIYFSRLHSTIPAQRKSLPEHLLENKKSNQFQERRKKSL